METDAAPASGAAEHVPMAATVAAEHCVETGGGAAEHPRMAVTSATEHLVEAAVGATQHMTDCLLPTVDDVIERFKDSKEPELQKLLAQAVSLRDTSGRGRKEALGNLAKEYGIRQRVKTDGAWKSRSLDELTIEISRAICEAAGTWLARGDANAAESQQSPAAEEQAKRRKLVPTEGAAEHVSSPYGQVVTVDGRQGVVQPLEVQAAEAGLSVLAIKRIGDDLFHTTIADDRVLQLDRQTLETLPQGRAKLATLLVRERVAMSRKRAEEEAASSEAASVKRGRRAEGAAEHLHADTAAASEVGDTQKLPLSAPEHPPSTASQLDPTPAPRRGISASPSSGTKRSIASERPLPGGTAVRSKQPTLRHMFGSKTASSEALNAEAHSGEVSSQAGEAEDAADTRCGARPEAEPTQPARKSRKVQDDASACGAEGTSTAADRDWLRAHKDDPRCAALLRETSAWDDVHDRESARSLAKKQGIKLNREKARNVDRVKEVARQYFREAIAQEKSRLTYFSEFVTRGTPENDAVDEALDIVNVVDLRTLRRFCQQRSDMPQSLKRVAKELTRGQILTRKELQETAEQIDVKLRWKAYFPTADVRRRSDPKKELQVPLPLQVAVVRAACLRKVRAWAATSTSTGVLLVELWSMGV